MSVNAAVRKYAKQRVKQTKTHLEKVYGKGLVGLFNKDGKMEHKRIRASSLVPAYNSVNLLGLPTFDAAQGKASIYGFAKGLQY